MRILFFMLCLFLCNCAGSPPAYYRLSLPENGFEPGFQKPEFHGQPILQILPVQLSPYLDSSKMVYQLSPQQFKYVEAHVWMPSLKEQITDFLVQSLQRDISNYWVMGLSHGVGLSKKKVLVSFSRFDFDKDSRVRIEGHWQWIKNGKIYQDIPFAHQETLTQAGYDALVAAFSRQLMILSSSISMKIEGP